METAWLRSTGRLLTHKLHLSVKFFFKMNNPNQAPYTYTTPWNDYFSSYFYISLCCLIYGQLGKVVFVRVSESVHLRPSLDSQVFNLCLKQ